MVEKEQKPVCEVKVIADTNIIISALINAKGKEADIILNPSYALDKYTCYFLYDEIQKHKGKIFRATGIKEPEYLLMKNRFPSLYGKRLCRIQLA